MDNQNPTDAAPHGQPLCGRLLLHRKLFTQSVKSSCHAVGSECYKCRVLVLCWSQLLSVNIALPFKQSRHLSRILILMFPTDVADAAPVAAAPREARRAGRRAAAPRRPRQEEGTTARPAATRQSRDAQLQTG